MIIHEDFNALKTGDFNDWVNDIDCFLIPRKIIKLNKYKNNTYLVINTDKIFITILSIFYYSMPFLLFSGGIPYGSITGMVAKYPGYLGQQFNSLQARQLNGFKSIQPVVITPNFRATRLAGVHPPVQIYNVPSVVAPGVVGTISHIGY